MNAKLNCSFCLKGADDVSRLLAGAAGYICDTCVDIAGDIVRKDREKVR